MASSDGSAAARHQQPFACYLCGRRGSRGYVVLDGKVNQPPNSVMCANHKACERRQAAAIRREAARGNWS